MNLNLNYEGFEQNLVTQRECCEDGIQYLFRFENGRGASVVKHSFSYGNQADLWELAVVKWNDDNSDWHLDYDTDITDDVLGFLSDEEVRETLQRIKGL